MKRRAGRGQRGFTIVELMIAMVLCTILIGVAFQIAITIVRGYRQHQEAVAVQRSARAAIDLISDAVRNGSAGVPSARLYDAAGCTAVAGIDVINSESGPDEVTVITASGGAITSVREDAITETSSTVTVLDATGIAPGDLVIVTDFTTGHVLKVADVTDNGSTATLVIDVGGCGGMTFVYDVGALVVRAKVSRFYVEDLDGVPTLFLDPDADGPEAAEPLAEGIEDLQIAVGVDQGGDGAITDTASFDDEWHYNSAGDDVPPAATTSPWRALRLTVVARTTTEDIGGEWSSPPSIEDHLGGAVDGHRRRVASTVVEIRNMEGSP